jgi:Domain of unknown function (DUF4411)
MSLAARSSNQYLLDANVFIEAAKHYYAFDIAPSFWNAVVNHCGTNACISIDRVKAEIDQGGDALAAWINAEITHGFASSADAAVVTAYRTVMTWATGHSRFTQAAKSEFARAADGWLVAYAMANSCILVTHEQLNDAIKKRIKIPNACKDMNVQYCNTFEMLRRLGERF